MNNLKGNLDIHLEEDHLGAPLPSSQVSACSAASHLSYHDSPRSQPLASTPEVEEEMSAGAISSPSLPKRSLGLLRRNEPLSSSPISPLPASCVPIVPWPGCHSHPSPSRFYGSFGHLVTDWSDLSRKDRSLVVSMASFR